MKDFALKVLVTLGIIIAVSLIPLSIYYVLPHFTPFILAYFVAVLLQPLNKKLIENFKMNRMLAVSISFFAFLGTFVVILYFIIARISTQLFDLVKFIQRNLPGIESWLMESFKITQTYVNLLPIEVASQVNSSVSSFVSGLANLNLIATIGAQTYSITTFIPNFFIQVLLFFVSLYLFNLHVDNINKGFFELFKPSSREKAILVLSDLRKATVGFVQAQLILSSITFTVSFIGLMILNVRYAMVIAFIIIIVDILPILGTGSVLVPWAVFMFSRGNTFLAIGLIILFISITTIRRIIEPKILGEKIGLSALTTLISIWIGFKVLGVGGVFLGPVSIILFKALIRAKVIRIYKI